jgi:hypothetical protein
LCLDDASAFSEARVGEESGAEQRIGARVRRSRQKKAVARRTLALCKLNGAKETRLADYNNDPAVTFADLQKFSQEIEVRLTKRRFRLFADLDERVIANALIENLRSPRQVGRKGTQGLH